MRSALALALALIAGLAPQAARAHIGHSIERAERYLKIDLREREVRLVVTLTLGEEEGLALMRSADDDGDGRVSEAEASAHLDAWGAALVEELALVAGAEPVDLAFGDGFFDPRGQVRRAVATLEIVGRGELPPGVYRLTLEDRMAGRERFDRTDVTITATPPVKILADGLGEPTRPPRGTYAFTPDHAPAPIVAEVQSPARELWKLVRILFLVALLGGGLAIRFASRRRKKRGPLGEPEGPPARG